MAKSLKKVEKHKDYDLNLKIKMYEMECYQKELWENNEFCSCGAKNIYKCNCDPDKKMRFKKRRQRKIGEKFGDELDNMLRGKLPSP